MLFLHNCIWWLDPLPVTQLCRMTGHFASDTTLLSDWALCQWHNFAGWLGPFPVTQLCYLSGPFASDTTLSSDWALCQWHNFAVWLDPFPVTQLCWMTGPFPSDITLLDDSNIIQILNSAKQSILSKRMYMFVVQFTLLYVEKLLHICVLRNYCQYNIILVISYL